MRSAPRRRVAVLLIDDQRRGRAPDHCVKTGVATSAATAVTAVDLFGAPWWQLLAGTALTRWLAIVLRRPHAEVAISVSERAWDIWRFRLGAALVIATTGAGIAVGGLVGNHPGFGIFGAIVLVAGSLVRIWTAWRRWFGLRYRRDREQVLVHRVSVAFDADARRLFIAHEGRRR